MVTRENGAAIHPDGVGVSQSRNTPGIIISDSNGEGALGGPRITAFIWGGKVRPQPTLPFGRWKGVA